ncbi:MAG: hypothetical protein ACFCUQ_01505 [Kiloniellales bacterium]
MRRHSPPFPDDPIYRAILFVLVLSVLAGALLALAGEAWFYDRGISRLGGWIAVVCGALYFFFRWLGRRAALRTKNDRRAEGDDSRDA